MSIPDGQDGSSTVCRATRLYLTLSGECLPTYPHQMASPSADPAFAFVPSAQGSRPTSHRGQEGNRGIKGVPARSVCEGFLKDAALPRAARQCCLSSQTPCSRSSALPLPGHEVSVCTNISILSFLISKMHTASQAP